MASGVLVSDDGLVVTNAHVAEGCQAIRATYISGPSRRSYDATLKYYDKATDTAVLKLPARDLDHFDLGPWAKYEEVRVGARVYAIGNPRGLEQSISEGIVSGIRKENGVTWIQHSAPISPGSSGGALISSAGDLLGINSFLLEDSQNLNFAVPASTLITALSAARSRVWREAAEHGDAEAASALRKAADEGDAPAQLNLGLLYYEGHAVPQDYAQAPAGVRKAAEQGNAEAQASLGAAYDMGRGVQQDYAQATAWLRKAAEQGYAKAQDRLGTAYALGKGVQQDDAQAAVWIRKAAEQGIADSQVYLGVSYMAGVGVPKDFSESYFWLKIATAGKTPGWVPGEIRSWLDFSAEHLTPAASSHVQERVREWLATHPTNPE